MKKGTFYLVTQNVMLFAKNEKDAKDRVDHQLHMEYCPICGNDIGEYIHYSKFAQPLAVREMELDQETKEWIPIGNGGD